MPIYMPKYFALGIYNYTTNCFGSINTYLNIIEQNRNYKRIVTIYKSFIKKGCLKVKEPKVIRVPILPQISITNYN